MYENLQKKIVGIAEKYADLINDQIVEAALIENSKNPEIGNNLHEIADSIRILHHTVAMLERLNRISHCNGNTVQLSKEN